RLFKVLTSEGEECSECTDDCGEYRDPCGQFLRVVEGRALVFFLDRIILVRVRGRFVVVGVCVFCIFVGRLCIGRRTNAREGVAGGSRLVFWSLVSGCDGGACEGYCYCGGAGNKCLAGEKLHDEILQRGESSIDVLIISRRSGFCNKTQRFYQECDLPHKRVGRM